MAYRGQNHWYKYPIFSPLRGYLAHKKHPPPSDLPKTLGKGLLQGLRGERFLMSKVILYPVDVCDTRLDAQVHIWLPS